MTRSVGYAKKTMYLDSFLEVTEDGLVLLESSIEVLQCLLPLMDSRVTPS